MWRPTRWARARRRPRSPGSPGPSRRTAAPSSRPIAIRSAATGSSSPGCRSTWSSPRPTSATSPKPTSPSSAPPSTSSAATSIRWSWCAPTNGRYWTPNGNHRLAAMRTLGARPSVAIVVPEAEVAHRILLLNTEKAHNLRERALEVVRLAQNLAELDDRPEREFEAEFEEPALAHARALLHGERAVRRRRVPSRCSSGSTSSSARRCRRRSRCGRSGRRGSSSWTTR